MRRRLLELIGVVAVFVAVIVLLMLAPVAGQAPTAPGQGDAAPTPWGEPDLTYRLSGPPTTTLL